MEESIQSRQRLRELATGFVAKKEKFTLGQTASRCLQVSLYSDDGIRLELHRGKRWEAWISPPLTKIEEIMSLFESYFSEEDLPDEVLNGDPEWDEVAGMHPAFYIVVAGIIMGLTIWTFLSN